MITGERIRAWCRWQLACLRDDMRRLARGRPAEPVLAALPLETARDYLRVADWPLRALEPHPTAHRTLIRRRVLSLYWDADQAARDARARAGWPIYT